MKNFKRFLIFLIITGLLASGIQIVRRVVAEQRNITVEIVADLDDFEEMASGMNVPIEEVAKKLIGSGTTSVAIAEEKLKDMRDDGRVMIYSGADFMNVKAKFNNEYIELANEIKAYMDTEKKDYSKNTIIFINNKVDYDFLVESFKTRFQGITQNFERENMYAILIDRKQDKVISTGLGLTDKDFEYAKTLGFNNIIPRLENHEGVTREEIDEIYNQLKKYKVRTIVFAGVTVLGQSYRDEENEMLKYIGEKFSQPGAEVITAIIEKPVETDLETVQRGIKALSKASNYVNTKVYSTDASQLSRLTPVALAEQWGRAISQRNVRVLYVRPLSKAEKTVTENFEDTLTAIREIKARVKYMGMKTGNAYGLGSINQNRYIQMLMGFGVMAASILLFILLFVKEENKKILNAIYVLFGLIMAGIAGVYCVSAIYGKFGDLANKAVALVASIVFPSLSGLYLIYKYLKHEKDKNLSIIKESVFLLVTAAVISGVGGLFVGGILSGSQYVLKLDVFRGVKLSFIVPVLVFGLAYVIKCGIYCDEKGKPLSLMKQCKKLLDTNITVKYGVAFALVVVALAVILLRSGNTLVSSASSLELAFRNFLEKYLVARPRTKELITLPFLMFVIYFAKNKYKDLGFLAMIVGMIGIESIVNSFCHIRMPVIITALSSIYSLIFAIVIGSIGIVILKKLKRK